MGSRHLLQGTPNESSGVPIIWQDQHTEGINVPLSIEVISGTILAASTAVNDTTITIDDATLVTAGHSVCIQEDGHIYSAIVKSKLTNTLTLKSPLDHEFTDAGAYVFIGNPNLAVAGGSLGSPVIAQLAPAAGVDWDITRLHVSIIGAGAMNSGLFGDIAALANGVVLRNVNGTTKNVGTATTNGELALLADNHIYDPNPPAAQEQFYSKHVFGGQGNMGVVQRVVGDENGRLEVLIQDDLSGLSAVSVIAIGHVVSNL
jgi:hypothetical protein